MKLRSLLSTCSATTSTVTDDTTTTTPPPQSNKLQSYDTTSTTSDSATTATSPSIDTSYNSGGSSGGSLHSNLSLQTLPSVPSLQKLSPESLNLAVSHGYLTSIKPSPSGHVNFLAVHNRLLYAAAGDRVHVFSTATLALLETLAVNNSPSGSVKSIAFVNGSVITSHQDSKIRVWKVTENKRKNKRRQHSHTETLPTLQDRLLRSILHKNYVDVRRHRRRLWIQHQDAVTGLAVIDDDLMCSISWDKCLKIWRTSNYRCVESIKAHDDAINAVAVAGDGTIFTGSADRRIKVWGRPSGEKRYGLVATLEKHRSAVNALAVDDGGGGSAAVLFSGACDRSILVWEKEDSANYMAVTGALRGHRKAILSLINVSDLLFSGSADRTVRIWQRGFDGKFCCLTVLDGHRQPVRSLVADPDPSGSGSETAIRVFSGGFDGEIRVWKVVVSNLASPMSNHLFRLKL